MSLDDLSDEELADWFVTVGQRAEERYPGSGSTRAYGSHPEQVIDFWGDPSSGSTVVSIHGGYFAPEYDRSISEPLCRRLASEGVGVANIEYRRTGSATHPLDTVADVRLAIRSVVESTPTGRVVLLGHSAGGYLALTGSTEPGVVGCVALAPATLLRRIHDEGVDNDALAQWIGTDPSTDGAAWDDLQPESVGVGASPLLILHGALDTVVPAEHSEDWVRERTASGSKVTLTLLPDCGHFEYMDPASPFADAVVQAVHDACRR